MSISSINSGLSGMQAFQRALDVTANNVANASTNGFEPQQTSFQTVSGGGVNASASAPVKPQSTTAANASSGTDLVKETVDSLQYKYGFDFSAQVVKTANETLGTLVNIKA